MSELSPGTTISHYRIISKIGAGGMGHVYRAQDTDLGRTVALKFLSSELAARQNQLNRFIQEAKAASALNHPNILTVYEIGRADDTTFIAMEFVEGLTLRHHMAQRLRLVEVLDIAIQIASALVAAHAAGIVHRDIKPENIMVRTDGIVKVLDFGLAKLTERQEVMAQSEATTVALVHTEPGTLLGTVAYMSPEQAAGRDVDARGDIWSLGVVIYEMVAARPPFGGASKNHIIVAISDYEPPPLNQFASEVPEALEWIIAEALTKDRDERCQTAKELLGKLRRLKQRIESGALPTSPSDLNRSSSSHSSIAPVALANKQSTLDETLRLTRQSSVSTAAPSNIESVASVLTRNKRTLFTVLSLGVIFVAAISFGLYSLLTRPKEFRPAKMSALTTGGKISGEDINGQLSISPDGKYVACSANDNKQQASLWIRQISTNSLMRLVPPENGFYVGTTFSPDGELIYYVAAFEKNKFVPALYRIPVLGGTPTKVLDRVFSPVAFSSDGKQFAFVGKNQDDMSLMLANTDGSGEPKTLAGTKPPNFYSTSGPSWSADGKRVALGMFSGTGAGNATVVEVPVQGGEPKAIGTDKWASVGRVVWLADGSGLIMTAQPESSSIGTQIWFVPYPKGQARRITNDLNAYGEVSLGVTADGGTISTIRVMNIGGIWVSNAGEDERQAQQVMKSDLPELVSWTTDGKIVHASRTGENWDIWIVNGDGSEARQLTNDAFIDVQPSVCGNGGYIVFQSNRSGGRNIWRINLDGTNAKQLTTGGYVDSFPVCSPDGGAVVFMSLRAGKSTIWKIGIDGGTPVQMVDRPSQLPAVSPDGKQIAYFYLEEQANSQPKLAIVPFEGGQEKAVDLPRSAQPIASAWLPDGRSVAFLDNSSGILNVWAQPIDGGAPKQLTNFKSQFVNSFAISRDGKIATYRFSGTRDIVLIKDFR